MTKNDQISIKIEAIDWLQMTKNEPKIDQNINPKLTQNKTNIDQKMTQKLSRNLTQNWPKQDPKIN